MSRLKLPFILSILFLSAVSCTETADLDPKEKFIQISCILENSKTQAITLFHTSYIAESAYLPVDEADVIVEEYIRGEKSNSYTFKGIGDGKWISEFTPKPRAEYKLNVNISGFPTITSSTEYPDTLSHIRGELINGKLNEDRLELTKYEYKTDSCYIWLHYADYIPGGNGWKISDSTMIARKNNDTYDYFNTNWESLPGLIYHDRYKRYHGPGRNEATNNIPFTTDLNSSNLWISEFNVYPICIILPGLKYRSTNPRYSEHKFSHPNSYIVLQSVDKAYDKYLRETYAITLGLNSPASSDLTSLWDYKEVYSNIDNGVGIFCSTFKHKLFLKDCMVINDPYWKIVTADVEFPE